MLKHARNFQSTMRNLVQSFIACFVIFIAMVDGVDDPYPSLSDFHDYEPNLEFDDSDLLNTQHPEVEGMS